MHNLYGALFESVYLECTREYYAAQFSKYKDPQVFLRDCIKMVQVEVDRAEAILPVSSRAAARNAAETGLIDGHAGWLARGVVGKLLDEKNIEELRKLHDLLLRAGADATLVEAFKSAVREHVSAIVKDVTRNEEMIDRLLEFKRVCDAAVEGSFRGPLRNYAYALTDGFTAGFLARRRAPAEMLAKHVDRLMRKGHEGASDEEFGKKLDSVLALYRFTDDKDVFRTFYHRSLSRRLLLGRSASDDFEKAVLKKLKEQYDPEFSMGDQMFSDLMLSRDMMREYHDRHQEGSNAFKLNVMILQQSVWPFSGRQQSSLHLPLAMQQELAAFEKFYSEKHKGRKLEWNHALGTATLTARFLSASKVQDKTKDLSVSLFQAAVLLLFQDVDPTEGKELTYKEILATLAIRRWFTSMRRTLQSLACGKKRVLKKLPPGRDVDDDDKFAINEKFQDPFHTVHINSIQAKETPEESKRTQQAIEGDRKHLLDAAIVRIMKAKKQLTYEEIKTQTIEAVRKHFAPDIASIKQRIDSLVEGEYLRRDDDDRTLFYYVA
ncbi:Cullin [Vararia minispora EC-137]|uniref:Cullin n=1 Tax=Vararia minispora EC-137 TaxID=1314806 RepID=A0ACB8QQJ7_9AGAM|nr:Cullin [Vararia minispora EC-137]